MRSRSVTILVFFIILTSMCSCAIESRHFVSNAIEFQDGPDRLVGVLNLPKEAVGIHDKRDQLLNRFGNKKIPIVLFIHGDGPMPSNGFGYYNYIWNELADKGIASMAWNKKGVGKSSGHWLDQSMQDRAIETKHAIDLVHTKYKGQFCSVGLMGFSQAGWVLPALASKSQGVNSIILVSPAIDWQRQRDYLTRKRLSLEGYNEVEIAIELKQNQQGLKLLQPGGSWENYRQATHSACKDAKNKSCDVMSEKRFRFVQKNYKVNASEALSKVEVPLFAVFGENDLNVDVSKVAPEYQALLKNSPASEIKVYPEATHSLLKADHFNYQKPGVQFLIKLKMWGRRAFTQNVLSDISSYILKNISNECVVES